MEYVKTFEAFNSRQEQSGSIKDKFDNSYSYHMFSTDHEIRFTIINSKKIVIAFLKLEIDITENFWEVEEIEINEKYRRHGLYFAMINICLKTIESKNSKGIVSRKYPIHKDAKRTELMDNFWENVYKDQMTLRVIITKKESDDNKEGWDYYIQTK